MQENSSIGCCTRGLPGLAGAAGDPGLDGSEGPPGNRGQNGKPGNLQTTVSANGQFCLKCLDAAPGPMGAAGERGPPGLKGSRGNAGNIGIRGDRGIQGSPVSNVCSFLLKNTCDVVFRVILGDQEGLDRKEPMVNLEKY